MPRAETLIEREEDTALPKSTVFEREEKLSLANLAEPEPEGAAAIRSQTAFGVPDELKHDNLSRVFLAGIPNPFLAATPQPKGKASGVFTSGLKTGAHNAVATLNGAGAVLAEQLFDSTGMRDHFVKQMIAASDRAAKASQHIDLPENLGEATPGQVGNFVMHTFGQLTPFAVESILGALAGGLLGLGAKQGIKLFAKKIIKKELSDRQKEALGKGFIGYVSKHPARIGAAAGAFSTNLAQGTGEIYSDTRSSVEALKGAVPFALMETAGEVVGLGGVLLPISRVGRMAVRGKGLTKARRVAGTGSRAGRFAGGVGATIGVEAATEAGQQRLIQGARARTDPEFDIEGPEAREELIQSAAAGAVGGLGFGSIANVSTLFGRRPGDRAPEEKRATEIRTRGKEIRESRERKQTIDRARNDFANFSGVPIAPPGNKITLDDIISQAEISSINAGVTDIGDVDPILDIKREFNINQKIAEELSPLEELLQEEVTIPEGARPPIKEPAKFQRRDLVDEATKVEIEGRLELDRLSGRQKEEIKPKERQAPKAPTATPRTPTIKEVPSAEEIRSDKEEEIKGRQIVEGGEDLSGPDIQQPEETRRPAPAPQKAKDVTPKKPAAPKVTTRRAVDRIANKTIQPTEAQIKANNYPKPSMDILGIPVQIETPAGKIRRGKDAKGREWSIKMKNHYGQIPGTKDKDGDPVDITLGPRATEPQLPIYVIDQLVPETGVFDEHKVIMGAATRDNALNIYYAGFEDKVIAKAHVGLVVKFDRDQFMEFIEDPVQTQNPAALSKVDISRIQPAPTVKQSLALFKKTMAERDLEAKRRAAERKKNDLFDDSPQTLKEATAYTEEVRTAQQDTGIQETEIVGELEIQEEIQDPDKSNTNNVKPCGPQKKPPLPDLEF